MMNVGELLKSKTRANVLSQLVRYPDPLGVRALASLADEQVNSVARILTQLLEEGFILKEGSRQRPVYQLNPEHHEFKRLQQVMTADTLATREQVTSSLDGKARQFMNFHREATHMMIRAKQSRHEPA